MFDEQDMEQIVIPFRELCQIFGRCLQLTYLACKDPDGDAYTESQDMWGVFGTKVCEFIYRVEDRT